MIKNYKIVQSDAILQLPKNNTSSLLESYETGGIDLLDSSQGLFVQTWQVRTDGKNIYIKAENDDFWRVLLADKNITEVDLTFDQNMKAHVSYVSNGISKFYRYDSVQAKMIIENYPDIRTPRISLDDKRRLSGSGNSDIIFAYIRNDTNELCYRVQRERYGIEHKTEITLGASDVLWRIGMAENNMFVFYVLGSL